MVWFSLNQEGWESCGLCYKPCWVQNPRKLEHLHPRAGEDGLSQLRETNSLFCSIQTLSGLMSTCIGEGSLLYSVYWFRCKPLSETSLPIYPEIMFYQPSGLCKSLIISSHKERVPTEGNGSYCLSINHLSQVINSEQEILKLHIMFLYYVSLYSQSKGSSQRILVMPVMSKY